MTRSLVCTLPLAVLFSCGGGTDAASVPSGAPAPMPEPVRSLAYVCKATVTATQWFEPTPDERMVLTAGVAEDLTGVPSPSGLIHAWNLESGELQFSFQLGELVSEMSRLIVGFDPQGRYVFSPGVFGSHAPMAVVWDLVKGTSTVLGPSVNAPFSAVVSHDGRFAATVGGSGILTIDLAQMKLLGRSEGVEGALNGSIHFSKDSRALLHRVFLAGGLTMRDRSSLQAVAAFDGFVEVSSDGSLFAVISETGAGLFDGNTGRKIRDLVTDARQMEGASFSPDATRLVLSADEDNRLVAFDVTTGVQLANVAGALGVNHWSPDGKALLTGQTLWNTTTWTPRELQGQNMMRPGAGHLFDAIDGDTLIETDALTYKPTGRTFHLKGASGETGRFSYQFIDEGRLVVFLNRGDNTMRLLRTSDHALLDLGVALIGDVRQGFVSTPEGSYDGPEAAMGCAPKTSRGRRLVPGLMKRFLAGEALD